MKVSELNGALLDYWVGRANGWMRSASVWVDARGVEQFHPATCYDPSRDLALGGEIIGNERIATWHGESGWRAIHPLAMPSGYSGDSHYIDITEGDGEFSGETLLVAAMRAYVASKFGAEVQDIELAKP